MTRTLTNYDQETIINFNKGEDIAYIFTYEKSWQKHLEGKLGLKPLYDNGFGGREYSMDKKRIPMPRVPKRLSESAKKELAERLNRNPVLSSKNTCTVAKSAAQIK